MKKWMQLFIVIFLMSGCAPEEEVPIFSQAFADRSYHFSSFSSPPSQLTIGMIGDILLHHPLYTYDTYDASFAAVRDELLAVDFLMANQESMPGGSDFGYSGYPAFNSPAHIIKGLQDVGVKLVSIANNHTLDRGEKGTLAAIENIRSYGMPYVGAYHSFEDEEEMRIQEVKGITLGFLAYTYGTNGIPTPAGKDYLVARIEEEKMIREISALKNEVDVVVVSMHWGNEYELFPNDYQKHYAQVIADAGGDLIFGHHPHVLQKFDQVTAADQREVPVFYSLGNFYSAQQFDYTDIGGIASITIQKNGKGENPISFHSPSFFPTAVMKDSSGFFKVVPLSSVDGSKKMTYAEVMDHVGVEN